MCGGTGWEGPHKKGLENGKILKKNKQKKKRKKTKQTKNQLKK